MPRTRWAVLLLVLATAAGGALRGWLIAGKRTLNHDEAISYLCAAGKQGLYREQAQAVAPPFGVWVPAAEIQSFLRPDDPLCFGRIAHDLAETDIHPPLYFWLLHLWVLAVGVHGWSGPALNALLALVATLALYGLARSVLRDRLAAAAVAAIWIVSPAVIETCFEARHYDLLALCTIGFVWALLRYLNDRAQWCDRHQNAKRQRAPQTRALACAARSDRRRRFAHGDLEREGEVGWRPLVPLSLVTLAGLLTHYHFVLILAAGGILLAARLRGRPRRLLAGSIAIGLGGLAFIAVHPRFIVSVLRAREQAQAFEVADILPRIESTLLCYSTFFVSTAYNAWLVHKYLLPLGITMLVGLLAVGLVVTRHSRAQAKVSQPGAIFHLFLTMAAANTVLYVAGVSPRHAMGPMYLAMVWPFLACLPILILVRLRRVGSLLMVLLCAGLLVSGAAGVRRQVARWQRMPDPEQFLRGAPAVVVDNVARGVLPCIAWQLTDRQPVFAVPESYLLDHTGEWLPRLEPGAVYVSVAGDGNSVEGQQRLLQALASHHEITSLDKGVFGVGRVHVLASSRAGTAGIGTGGH